MFVRPWRTVLDALLVIALMIIVLSTVFGVVQIVGTF